MSNRVDWATGKLVGDVIRQLAPDIYPDRHSRRTLQSFLREPLRNLRFKFPCLKWPRDTLFVADQRCQPGLLSLRWSPRLPPTASLQPLLPCISAGRKSTGTLLSAVAWLHCYKPGWLLVVLPLSAEPHRCFSKTVQYQARLPVSVLISDSTLCNTQKPYGISNFSSHSH